MSPLRLAILVPALALACTDDPPPTDAGPADSPSDLGADLGPPTPSCEALCSGLSSRCEGLSAAPCLAACTTGSLPGDGGATRDVRACLASAGDPCAAARACLRAPPSTPFSTGPYGTGVRDLAGPFTLPTTQGEWSFQSEWTGEDSYVFLVHAPGALVFRNGVDYSEELFGDSLGDLLSASPRNVHYVFLWLRQEDDFRAARERWQAELSDLPAEERAHWAPRVHFVTTRADQLSNWVGQRIAARVRDALPYKRYDPLQFAIDPDQRLREVGQLGRLVTNGLTTELRLLAKEPEYYNFERARARRLARDGATVVTLARARTVHESFITEADLPDATTMATFDTLEVDLATECPHHRDGECGAWDYLSHLWLCEPALPTGDAGADAGADGGDAGPPPPRCERELARWITTYWREGRWVTDISGVLPFLREGGRRTFRWYASGQWDPRSTDYTVSLSLRLSNQRRGMRPVEAIPLWTGGTLDANYDRARLPSRFTVPEGTRRVELYSLLTGHGGNAPYNCNEFCNHEHHFAINGRDHLQSFPEAQSPDGCASRVNSGVVPNQHGTWYYGRGGWCPGLDVAPWVVDVTPDLRPGAENEARYTTTFRGAAVDRSLGNVVLSSYLVFWR